jgi:hypothetical protein
MDRPTKGLYLTAAFVTCGVVKLWAGDGFLGYALWFATIVLFLWPILHSRVPLREVVPIVLIAGVSAASLVFLVRDVVAVRVGDGAGMIIGVIAAPVIVFGAAAARFYAWRRKPMQ